MDNFAALPLKWRSPLIEEASNRKGVNPVIIEKDFWVCWILDHIYKINDIAPFLVFKGGTSLSKAYGLINRFSEDIDLTISKTAPIFSGLDVSGNKYVKKLRSKARQYVSEVILPTLENELFPILNSEEIFSIQLADDDKDKLTLIFNYPGIFDDPSRYIKSEIRLEFGARGDVEPQEKKEIKPYISEEIEQFEEYFGSSISIIPTLAAERTLWEKITILHALYHSFNFRDRISRHYYDIAMLANSKISDGAITNLGLLTRVVENKSKFFEDDSASYATTKAGSLKLVPHAKLEKQLRGDYDKMEEMFMGSSFPVFDKVLEDITKLEDKINVQRSE